jgi:multiple sugar transport system substrate-binding protein
MGESTPGTSCHNKRVEDHYYLSQAEAVRKATASFLIILRKGFVIMSFQSEISHSLKVFIFFLDLVNQMRHIVTRQVHFCPLCDFKDGKQVKILVYISILMALILLLAACNNDEISTPTAILSTPSAPATIITPSPTPTSTPEPEPVSSIEVDLSQLDGLTLEFWYVWAGEPGNVVDTLVEEFNTSNEFGIIIQPVFAGNYNELDNKIQQLAGEGDYPNVMVGFDYQILTWEAQLSNLVDLTTYTEDPVWGFTKADQGDFYAQIWEQDQINSTPYGTPFHYSTYLMIYNSSWAQELGFDTPPRDPDEFRQQVCAATRANTANPDTRSGTGGWVVNTAPSAILSWMYAFGSNVISLENDGYNFTTPETEQAFVYLKALYDSGCAWQIGEQYAEKEFAERLALIITASLVDLPYINEAMQASQNNDTWIVLGFPALEEHAAISFYGPSLAMLRSSEEEQLASWIFMKWLVSPEIQAEWVQASGVFPVRQSTLEYLTGFMAENPQWASALDLLPYARREPQFASWGIVRWAVSDVGTQTFRYYFEEERIPSMLDLLDSTAAEIHALFR